MAMRVLVHQIGGNDQMLSPWQRRIASTEEKKDSPVALSHHPPCHIRNRMAGEGCGR